MKYTLCITRECNLACEYCYVCKGKVAMPLEVARKAVDFIYRTAPPSEKIHIGFFGGEPMLEFGRVVAVTDMIEGHRSFDPARVEIALVTNGTLFSDQAAAFFNAHNFNFCLSCDGPPPVQNAFRRFPDGTGSSRFVESTIRKAIQLLPQVLVNAVYHPRTFRRLPDVVEYFCSLGLTQIYLSADISAGWTKQEADLLPEIYRRLGELYMQEYLRDTPRFISLIDSKIAVILRGGYHPSEWCQMGRKEVAITADGRIYPCERLIGDGTDEHCMGDIDRGVNRQCLACKARPGESVNPECVSCGLRKYCMNWCGCSNYASTHRYDRVGPFLCASERAAVQVAFDVLQVLEGQLGPTFADHLGGRPSLKGTRAEKGGAMIHVRSPP